MGTGSGGVRSCVIHMVQKRAGIVIDGDYGRHTQDRFPIGGAFVYDPV